MLIPRFWARVTSQAITPEGKQVTFHTWRGSRQGEEEARGLATEAAQRIAVRIAHGEGFPERYTYGDRPLREEVVLEMPGAGDDAPAVAITRNSYGALVLNAARAFFIDVDQPHSDSAPAAAAPGANPAAALLDSELGRAVTGALPSGVRSLVEGFFGRAATPAAAPTPPPPPATPADAAIARLREWLRARPEWSVRVYRTSAGLRYLVTHALFDPTGAEAIGAMQALGADAQYLQLCRAQKSFRARLTPKPWRVHVANPPVSFPFESPDDEAAMRAWEARYQQASQSYATCALVEVIGSGVEHPEVAPLVRMHDEHTGATSGRPLA